MYSVILMLAFAAYIVFDYVKVSHNPYKLAFILPMLYSIPLLTTWVASWPAAVFAVYRVSLILLTLFIGYRYYIDIRKRHTAQVLAAEAKAKKSPGRQKKN